MVTAMRTAAISQPTAIQKPPKTIHSKLSKSDKADIDSFPKLRMPSLVLPSRLWDALDLSTEIAIFQTVQSKLFATRNAIGLLVDIVSDAHGSAVSIAQPEAAALLRAGWRRRRPASANPHPVRQSPTTL